MQAVFLFNGRHCLLVDKDITALSDFFPFHVTPDAVLRPI